MAQSIDNLESVADTELSSDVLSLEAVIDTEFSGSDDVFDSSGDTSSSLSYDEQILAELKVTNGLLGFSIALNIFFLGLFFLVFFIKVIKNNVTNLFT